MQRKLGLKNILLKSLSFLMLAACSSNGHLNRIEHTFAVKPTRIIWLQVPGLSEEHISLLKFYASDLKDRTEFEQFHCLGKMWNYHTSDLRPNSQKSLMSQMTGQMDVEGNCTDYDKKPVWNIENRIRYKVGFFSDKMQLNKCEANKKKFYEGATRWYMSSKPANEGLYYNADEVSAFKDDQVYYDRSCQSGKCYRDFDDNIKNTFSRFISGKNFYFYIAQIYQLEELIKKKQVQKIHEFLTKLDSIINFMKSKTSQRQDAVILLTSSNVKGIEFPAKGMNWKDKLKSRRDIYYRRSQTQSLAMAYGARAESFCGLFHQSEIPMRLLTSPE